MISLLHLYRLPTVQTSVWQYCINFWRRSCAGSDKKGLSGDFKMPWWLKCLTPAPSQLQKVTSLTKSKSMSIKIIKINITSQKSTKIHKKINLFFLNQRPWLVQSQVLLSYSNSCLMMICVIPIHLKYILTILTSAVYVKSIRQFSWSTA